MKLSKYKGRRLNSKGKQGVKIKCPKCSYLWRSKQKGFICCSKCKRYFKK